MNVSNLGCLTTNGDHFDFSVLDVPVLIDDSRFVLFKRPGTPILLLNTVVAGADIENIYEGSVIVSDGVEYTITYKRGFAAMDKDRNVVKLSHLPSFVKVGQLYRFSKYVCRQRLLYRAGEAQINFKDFIGTFGDDIIVREGYTFLKPDQLRLYAGLSINKNKIFLGDTLGDGSIVKMHKGRICAFKNNQYTDLVDNEVIV